MNQPIERVWVFMGEDAIHPAAVYDSLDAAEQWISEQGLTGMLTRYPLNQSVYHWVVSNQYFTPKYPSQTTPRFIGRFSSAYLEHYHYEDGVRVS